MNSKYISDFLLTVGIMLSIFLLSFVVEYSMTKSDVEDCLKWQKEATEMRGFYLTHAEADQCTALNINVVAPII